MRQIFIVCAVISLIACQPLNAKSASDVRGSHSSQYHIVSIKKDKPFDPQKLIGLSLDTVRIFFAMIGRVTEENVGGEVHLHALSADSLSHGTRPSEVDAIVGKNGTRAFTLSFYKLPPDAAVFKKFSGHEMGGGKLLSFAGEVEFPNMLAHVEMNAKAGMFSMACRAK